jgi:hypothetical protein
MNIHNTILIDDREDLEKEQPECNILRVKQFHAGDNNDNELLHCIAKLKEMKLKYY